MPQIERILCPIDFSEFSEKAYEYAQSLAWHYKATLFLQHVIDSLTPLYHYEILFQTPTTRSARPFALAPSASFRSLRKNIPGKGSNPNARWGMAQRQT